MLRLLIVHSLFAAFLDITADKLLRVLFENVVDFVEEGVDVLGQLLVALLEVGGGGLLGLDLLGLVVATAAVGLAPAAGVPARHGCLLSSRAPRTAPPVR